MAEINYEQGSKFMRWACAVFVILVILACSVGCSTAPAPQPSLRTDPELIHTVKSRGETLGEISRWYTGSASNWNKIAAQNPKLKVTSLRLGQSITIPKHLIRTRESMPASGNRARLKEAAPEKPKPDPVLAAPAAAAPVTAPDALLFTQSSDLRAIAPPVTRTSANGEGPLPAPENKIFTCQGSDCQAGPGTGE